MSEDCLFCKIVHGQVEAEIVYSDEDLVAFNDINPKAPVHVLFIPRKHISTLNDVSDKEGVLIGKIFTKIKLFAEKKGFAEEGYRVVVNCNKGAGQEVFHVHVHLLAGRDFGWPPG